VNSSTSNSDPARVGADPDPLAGNAGYLRVLVLAAIGLTLLIGLFNWRVDPLQLYRRAGYAPVFIENQRYQNPGLAKHYDYETVVIGTSHAENFLPGDIARALGERGLKLAIAGSTAHEQHLILRKAIETGRVRHVIWLLDHIAFKKPATAVGSRREDFPAHLYVEGPRAVGLYLLSLDSLRLSVDALLGLGHGELETLNTWYRDFRFSEQSTLADWRRRGAILDRINRDPRYVRTPTGPRSRASVRANLLSLAQAHPEIRFDLVFPPFSVLAYLADHRTSELAFGERLAYKRFVVESTAALPNVRVFDFQVVREITHDLDHYKDLDHFGIEVNRYILQSLAEERHRVDAARYDAVLQEHAAQVEHYRRSVCDARSTRRELCPRVARPGDR
jgi:hypothetical protein